MEFFSGLKTKTMQLAEYVSDQSKGGENDGEEKSTWSSPHTFGAKLMSYAKEGANQMKNAIDGGMLGEMERNRQEHESRVESGRVEGGRFPWEGLPNETLAMKQILGLSLDTRNLVNDPPGEVEFTQIEMEQMAISLIERDSNLAKARFQLVPKELNEERFWKNYFYRVSLIRTRMMQSAECEKTKEDDSEGVKCEESKEETIDNEVKNANNQPIKSESTSSSPCDVDWEAEILAHLEKEEEYEVVDGDRREIDDLLE